MSSLSSKTSVKIIKEVLIQTSYVRLDISLAVQNLKEKFHAQESF